MRRPKSRWEARARVEFESAARLIGGVGLFLLGMRLMTDGLKYAAGSSLRRILARSTRTRLRGVLSGIGVTALVQSSSAVTVASIGFVNAGLLDLSQALAVAYGSNIGTTATGWLVAAVGLRIHVAAFALPLIGVGMLGRLFGRRPRLAALGEALAGFGVFFLGIETLRVAFEGFGDAVVLGGVVGAGPFRVVLYVAVGFVLTLVMQSSSAAIALVLTAAEGDVIPLGAGAALVIGANVGTTSTAALAVVGATPNAKRVAAGHVAFNVLTGVVALCLLPVLLFVLVRGRELLDLDAAPAAVLAGFHTLFNLLGVALLWPWTGRLVAFLERRFRTSEEIEGRPRFLDKNVLSTPHLALNATVMELSRVGQMARRLAGLALSTDPGAATRIARGRGTLLTLVEAIGRFSQRLQRTGIPEDMQELLPTTLRVSRYYAEVAELAEGLATSRPEPTDVRDEALRARIAAYVSDVAALVERAGIERADYDADAIARELDGLEEAYHALKASLLAAGARGAVEVRALVGTLDWLSATRRLAEQAERGARFLAALRTAEPDAPAPVSEDGGEGAGPPARSPA